ncbi:MAG: hypothetical protein AB7V58_01265 [Solirubrobacterales bacterium]
MIGSLRQLAARPIAESERRAAFAIAAAVVAIAAFGLLLSGGGSLPSPATTATPDLARIASPPAGRRSASEAAAVRFLEDYLPFLYGRGGAGSIRAAVPRLAERLVRSRVRVPPAARSRRPRLEAIGARDLAGSRALVRARVGDGVVSYTIALALARFEDRWLVVSVGAE